MENDGGGAGFREERVDWLTCVSFVQGKTLGREF